MFQQRLSARQFQMDPCVDIVIVNWNAGAQLAACLASVAQAVSSGASASVVRTVVVVDNGSVDGSADRLPDIGMPVTVDRNRRNRGFGAACNQGARRGSAPFLLFLNPDTRLNPATLASASAALADTPRSGALGVQLIDERNRVARSCARFPTALTMTARALGADRLWPARLGYVMAEWDHGHTRSVDHVIGAFYLVRRSAFEAVGGFDERFFLYLEDVDLSLRLGRVGWSCLYFVGAHAFHRGGGSSARVRDRRLAYALRSRLAYAAKHFSRAGAACVWAATLLVEPVIRVLRAGVRLRFDECHETIGGYAWLWRDLVSYGVRSPAPEALNAARQSPR